MGFPPGGSSDILARTIGIKLAEIWGQSVVVDNRPGASGVMANAMVAKAPADGHTMLLMSNTFANLIAMGKKRPMTRSAIWKRWRNWPQCRMCCRCIPACR